MRWWVVGMKKRELNEMEWVRAERVEREGDWD